jgi:hypothetical protein
VGRVWYPSCGTNDLAIENWSGEYPSELRCNRETARGRREKRCRGDQKLVITPWLHGRQPVLRPTVSVWAKWRRAGNRPKGDADTARARLQGILRTWLKLADRARCRCSPVWSRVGADDGEACADHARADVATRTSSGRVGTFKEPRCDDSSCTTPRASAHHAGHCQASSAESDTANRKPGLGNGWRPSSARGCSGLGAFSSSMEAM